MLHLASLLLLLRLPLLFLIFKSSDLFVTLPFTLFYYIFLFYLISPFFFFFFFFFFYFLLPISSLRFLSLLSHSAITFQFFFKWRTLYVRHSFGSPLALSALLLLIQYLYGFGA